MVSGHIHLYIWGKEERKCTGQKDNKKLNICSNKCNYHFVLWENQKNHIKSIKNDKSFFKMKLVSEKVPKILTDIKLGGILYLDSFFSH